MFDLNCVHAGFAFSLVSIKPELQTYSSTRSRRNELEAKPEPPTNSICWETQLPFGLSNNLDTVKNSISDSFSSKKFKLDFMNSAWSFWFPFTKSDVLQLISKNASWCEGNISRDFSKSAIASWGVLSISPTTSFERLKKIIKDSHDMIYYISMLSTTGGKLKVSPKKILERYKKIKRLDKSKNVVIGFGITEKTKKSLKKVWAGRFQI